MSNKKAFVVSAALSLSQHAITRALKAMRGCCGVVGICICLAVHDSDRTDPGFIPRRQHRSLKGVTDEEAILVCNFRAARQKDAFCGAVAILNGIAPHEIETLSIARLEALRPPPSCASALLLQASCKRR